MFQAPSKSIRIQSHRISAHTYVFGHEPTKYIHIVEPPFFTYYSGGFETFHITKACYQIFARLVFRVKF